METVDVEKVIGFATMDTPTLKREYQKSLLTGVERALRGVNAVSQHESLLIREELQRREIHRRGLRWIAQKRVEGVEQVQGMWDRALAAIVDAMNRGELTMEDVQRMVK